MTIKEGIKDVSTNSRSRSLATLVSCLVVCLFVIPDVLHHQTVSASVPVVLAVYIGIWYYLGACGYGDILPTNKGILLALVIIFTAALPGMVLLYYQQMVKLLHIFKVYRVSKKVGFYIYLREWLQDKINDDKMDNENPDIYSRYSEPDYHHDLDKIRLN